jgi:hypothetical protein
MCLDRLEKFPVRKNADGWIVAWKVFEKRGDYLKFPSRKAKSFSVGSRVHRAQGGIIGISPTYQSGYHAYKTRAEAFGGPYVFGSIRRVLLKDITATGYQNGLRVIVARKMIVPKEGQ